MHLSSIDTGAITARRSSRGSMQLLSWVTIFPPATPNLIIRFRQHGQKSCCITVHLCCVIFLDTGTFSSDYYLCIFELAISPMHIFEKEFYYYHSKWIMYVSCPDIQYWVLTNISFFLSITLTVIMSCHLYSSWSFVFVYLYSYLIYFSVFKKVIHFQTLYYDFFLTLTFLRPFDNKCDGFFRSLNYKIIYRSQYITIYPYISC